MLPTQTHFFMRSCKVEESYTMAKLLFFSQAKKSPPKKAKPSLESSSDEEVVSRVPRAGRARAPVKYFDNDSDSDDKENENTRDWSGSDEDYDDEE